MAQTTPLAMLRYYASHSLFEIVANDSIALSAQYNGNRGTNTRLCMMHLICSTCQPHRLVRIAVMAHHLKYTLYYAGCRFVTKTIGHLMCLLRIKDENDENATEALECFTTSFIYLLVLHTIRHRRFQYKSKYRSTLSLLRPSNEVCAFFVGLLALDVSIRPNLHSCKFSGRFQSKLMCFMWGFVLYQ